MNNDRKVIPLNAKFKKQLVVTTPNDLRAAATATIGLLLFIMVGFNFSMFEVKRAEHISENRKMERGIASIPSVMEPQWQRNLAQLNRSMLAQSGRKPTAMESLSFGTLEGKYALELQGGKIKNIQLSDQSAEPKLVGDRMEFIKDHAVVLAPGFQSVEKLRVEVSQVGYKETYKVISAMSQKIFEFQIDDQNRMVSLEIK